MAVAVRLGVSQGKVSKWEADSLEPSLDELRQLAAYYGVTGGWLAFEELPRYPGGQATAAPIAGVAQLPSVNAVEAAETDAEELARQNQLRAVGAGPVDQASVPGPSQLGGASKGRKRRRSS